MSKQSDARSTQLINDEIDFRQVFDSLSRRKVLIAKIPLRVLF